MGVTGVTVLACLRVDLAFKVFWKYYSKMLMCCVPGVCDHESKGAGLCDIDVW